MLARSGCPPFWLTLSATGRSATFVRLESTSLPSALSAHRGRGYPWGYSLNLGDRRRGIQRHAEPRVIDPSSTKKKAIDGYQWIAKVGSCTSPFGSPPLDAADRVRSL